MQSDRELKTINIELTSVCNYCCVGCPNSFLLRGHHHMECGLFKKIIDECGDKVEKLYLWNYGDPLLHPNLADLLEYAGLFPCKKILSTNGSHLQDYGDCSCFKNIDELIISINGFTEDVYKIHQKGGDLQKVKDGLRTTLPFFRMLGTRKILQMVAHKANIKQLRLAREFAKEYEFDELVIKSFVVMDGQEMTYNTFVPEEVEYSRYTHIHAHKEANAFPCQCSMVINYDGTINPCCWDYRGEHVFGNVESKEIYEYWKSNKYIQFRKNIGTEYLMPACAWCRGSKILKRENITEGDVSSGTTSI